MSAWPQSGDQQPNAAAGVIRDDRTVTDIFEQIKYKPCGSAPAQRPPADVAPAEPLLPVYAVDRPIGLGLRLGRVLAERGDAEHATAIGQDLVGVPSRPGVEDLDRLAIGGLRETPYLAALERLAGIALCGEHDAERGLVAPAEVEILERALARGDQRRPDVAPQPPHQHLA